MSSDTHITTKSGKTGPSLDQVLRDVLREMERSRGWNESEAGRATGLGQRTYNRFINGEQGLKLDKVSIVCAELELNPVQLFGSHAFYDEEARAKLRYPKDTLYAKFRSALTLVEAKKLVDSVEQQKKLGVFDACVVVCDTIVDAAKTAAQRAFQKARKEGPTARRGSKAG